LPHAGEVLGLFREAYRPGRSLAGAFAEVLATLFGDEGLVILDPRDAALAALAAPAYRRAIDGAAAIEARLLERGAVLRASDIGEQVRVREGATLLFFHEGHEGHEGAADGPRYRIERAGGGGFRVGERAVARDELERALIAEPLRFSTSALLRPLVQDVLLPTAAYVGGPGEINYYAQLAPLYELFDLAPPLIVPRARFRLIEPNVRALLDRFGLTPAEIEQGKTAKPDIDVPGADPDALRAGIADDLLRRLAPLDALAPALGHGLPRALARTRGTVARVADRLAARLARALADRDRVTTERMERLRRALLPDGVPQERYYSLVYYACRHGARALAERVLAAIVPFDPAIRDIDA